MKYPVLPKVLKLPLTQADRNDLHCGMPTKCIISRALGRTHPEITYVKTNPNKLTITYWGTIYIYAVSDRAVEIQHAFDRGLPMDLDGTVLTFKLLETRASDWCGYNNAERAAHAAHAHKKRAEPGYVRPDHRQTLRMKMAESV